MQNSCDVTPVYEEQLLNKGQSRDFARDTLGLNSKLMALPHDFFFSEPKNRNASRTLRVSNNRTASIERT